jgi:hypothetical protein
MNPWTVEQATEWYRRTPPIRGCNYLPRTAVNDVEMWQAETFDPETIDQELGWAQAIGHNGIRVFLQHAVWAHDPASFQERFDRFLAIAERHGIRTMPVLFDDCAFGGKAPQLGKQLDPVPGVHNSRWVPSPALIAVTDRAAWPSLRQYVAALVGAFARDARVLIWDLYNEPGNSEMHEKSLPLVEAAFDWARAAAPAQPLTCGPWEKFDSPMSGRLAELSDVVSFHAYDAAGKVEERIKFFARAGRPVICTEWLNRGSGNSFAALLPVFARHRVGWYQWGLVAGRTQTYLAWSSKPGDAAPALWQHDLLHPDGKPFDAEEIELIRRCRES